VVVSGRTLLRAAVSFACKALTSFCTDRMVEACALLSEASRWFSACNVVVWLRRACVSVDRAFCAASSFLREAIISS
jgi:hypothetical protein